MRLRSPILKDVMSDLSMPLLLVVLLGGMYFLMIRPQQKRAKKQADLMKTIGPGQRVILASGVFGTVKYWGEKQAVIEISPGVDLTVLKQSVVRPLKDDEDEFEYVDSDLADPTPDESSWPTMDASDAETTPAAPAAADEAAQAARPDQPSSTTGETR